MKTSLLGKYVFVPNWNQQGKIVSVYQDGPFLQVAVRLEQSNKYVTVPVNSLISVVQPPKKPKPCPPVPKPPPAPVTPKVKP